MLHILHGENQLNSRTKRQTLLTNYAQKGYEIRTLSGESILAQDLKSILLTSNLFAFEVVVIDNLFSRPKSKEKEACLKLLTQPSDKPIIIWEKKELTPATLKPFAKLAQIEVFPATPTLFHFVCAIKPKNQQNLLPLFHRALKDNDIMLIFGMLVRRVTDLLIALDNPSLLRGSPRNVKQIIAQAKSWTPQKLQHLHTQLLNIDLKQKTGNTKLDLTSQLDLLFLQI